MKLKVQNKYEGKKDGSLMLTIGNSVNFDCCIYEA